ncbi:6100_t:CDS:2, partial [Acaulospora colombiana]
MTNTSGETRAKESAAAMPSTVKVVIFKTLAKSEVEESVEEKLEEEKQVYTFDHVFGEESTQQEVYENAMEGLIEKFLDGYNVTVLTYGKSSSGKSYTL